MSLQALKVELDSRNGRDLFPEAFPMALLISLTRETTAHLAGVTSGDDAVSVSSLLTDYFRRTTAMWGKEEKRLLEKKEEKLIPLLTRELHKELCAQIVAKVTGFDAKLYRLQERFITVIKNHDD